MNIWLASYSFCEILRGQLFITRHLFDIHQTLVTQLHFFVFGIVFVLANRKCFFKAGIVCIFSFTYSSHDCNLINLTLYLQPNLINFSIIGTPPTQAGLSVCPLYLMLVRNGIISFYNLSISEKKIRFHMLFQSKSNRSLVKNKQLSLQHLNTMSTFLENQQNNTLYINKEIKNQIQLAKKNDRLIDKTITKINDQGENLIRKYEEEKEKNEKLQFLVKHIEDEIYRAKLDKSLELKDKIETDKLEECTNVLKNKEKDLEKVCEKTNTSSYELSKKLDTIRALRSERTIFSTLFDKIERQLCNLEHCYKVLVIERNIEEHEYKQKVEEFNRCQTSANKELDKLMSRGLRENRDLTQNQEPKISVKGSKDGQCLFRASFSINAEEEDGKSVRYNQSEFAKQKDKQQKDKKIKHHSDFLKIERQKKVKIVFNDLGILSTKDLPSNIGQLEQSNDVLLDQASKLFEEILVLEDKIATLNKKKKKQSGISSKRTQIVHKKQLLSKVSKQMKQNRWELGQFKDICKILIKDIKQTDTISNSQQQFDFLNDEEEIVSYMSQLQKYFEKSYLDGKNNLDKPKKQKFESKRLTSLLSTHQFERNHMSIYQEKDLLDFAKKNLDKITKSASKSQK